MASRAPLAVLVIGPHRSGTSCVTEVIHTLGFRVGRDLLGERPDNPRGLWENAGLVAASEALLARAASAWYDPGLLDLSEVLDTAVSEAELATAIEAQFGRASQPLVIKDPRLCRLVGPCTAALRGLGYRVRFVLVLRAPLASAESLYRRDGIPRQVGLALWLSHMLGALRALRGQEARVVDYDALLDGGAQLAGLAGWLRDGAAPDAAELERLGVCVELGLRHAGATPEGRPAGPLADLAKALFDRLTGTTRPAVGVALLALWERRFRAVVGGPRWLARRLVVVRHGAGEEIAPPPLGRTPAGSLLVCDGGEAQAVLAPQLAAEVIAGRLGLFWNLGSRGEVASLMRGATLAGRASQVLLVRRAAWGVVDQLLKCCAASSVPLELVSGEGAPLALWLPVPAARRVQWHHVELGEAAWQALVDELAIGRQCASAG